MSLEAILYNMGFDYRYCDDTGVHFICPNRVGFGHVPDLEYKCEDEVRAFIKGFEVAQSKIIPTCAVEPSPIIGRGYNE